VDADGPARPEQKAPSAVIADELGHWLGAHTARTALRIFAQSATGKAPDQLLPLDVPRVLNAMRPMLNTLLGSQRAHQVLETIARRFAP
jgi:hypothetical protein